MCLILAIAICNSFLKVCQRKMATWIDSCTQYKSHLFSLIDRSIGVDAILFGHDKQKMEQGESWTVLDLFEHYLTQ